MNKSPERLAKYLPAILFVLIPAICILVGWVIGISFGRFNPEFLHEGHFRPSPSQAIVLGGIIGGLWGMTFGSFFSFGGFGLIISWIWRKKYAEMKLGYSLLVVAGWMFAPAVLCLATMFFLFLM